jgi:hypothetical protein
MADSLDQTLAALALEVTRRETIRGLVAAHGGRLIAVGIIFVVHVLIERYQA